ncbi:single-stranded DNA-binding protein [Microcoleus sp. FACHB-SPT15]|uniref:single-stranded DNA-binding protein n=1 Tax=Microcoleus sp. FACHB-SPT15 TaxID=2692830 RepID=UPI001781B01A|nr:single-stranded DNA-binding protein [Microcoleus sp. FACHB-SPT15]MBD1806464.1 single-stranded DNA-binding protein [Microcoleus sp. FACHB-SPT15]
MNTCILMAQIIQDPELRYTSDNQTPIAQMLVQFPGQRAEDPPATLKIVGWGNFASEIKENYSVGDRVIIEGRLNMNTIDRPEGFKEKRAELTASRIHKLGADTSFEPHVAVPATSSYEAPAPTSLPKSNNVVVPMRSPRQSAPMSDRSDFEADYDSEPMFEPATVKTAPVGNADSQKDLDDIPF